MTPLIQFPHPLPMNHFCIVVRVQEDNVYITITMFNQNCVQKKKKCTLNKNKPTDASYSKGYYS